MSTREECEGWMARQASASEAAEQAWACVNGDISPTIIGVLAGALDKIAALEARIAALEPPPPEPEPEPDLSEEW